MEGDKMGLILEPMWRGHTRYTQKFRGAADDGRIHEAYLETIMIASQQLSNSYLYVMPVLTTTYDLAVGE